MDATKLSKSLTKPSSPQGLTFHSFIDLLNDNNYTPGSQTGSNNANATTTPTPSTTTTTPTTPGYIENTTMSIANWFRDRLLKSTRSTQPSNSSTPLPPEITTNASTTNKRRFSSISNTNSSANEINAESKDKFANSFSFVSEIPPAIPSSYNPSQNNISNVVTKCLNDTNLSIAYVGSNGAGKSLLLNSIFESTWPSEEEYAKMDKSAISANLPKDVVLNLGVDNNFAQTINWNAEKLRQTNIKRYFLTRTAHSNDFILPQRFHQPHLSKLNSFYQNQNSAAASSGANTRISYGIVPELIVTFKKEGQVSSTNITPQLFASLRPLLGKKVRFVGTGQRLAIDRLFIRDKIKEINQKYGNFVAEFLLKIPSTYLIDNSREITEVAIKDKKVSTVSQNAQPNNVVVVVVDERGITEDISNFLHSSGFIHKLVRNPIDFKLVLVYMVETVTTVPNETKLTSTDIHRQFVNFLKEKAPAPYRASLTKLGSSISVIPIQPMLYTSLLVNSKLDSVDRTQFRNAMIATNLPNFINTIENTIVCRAAAKVTDMTKDWISKYNSGLATGKLEKPEPQLQVVTPDSTPEIAPSARRVPILQANEENPIGSTKRLIMEVSSEMGTGLNKVAKESYEKATSGWVDFREQYMQSSESCRILLDPKFKGECLGADVNLLTCSSLIETAPVAWRQELLAKMPKKITDILQNSHNLLKDCVSASGAARTKQPSPLEKVRLKRLMEFCDSVHQRTAERVNNIKKALLSQDPESLVRSACVDAVNSKILSKSVGINSLKNYHKLMQDALPDVPVAAANNIKQKFDGILNESMEQLSAIESELNRSAQLVLIALKTEPEELRNKKMKLSELLESNKQQKEAEKRATQSMEVTKETSITTTNQSQSIGNQQSQTPATKSKKVTPWAIVSGLHDTKIDPQLFTPQAWQLSPSDARIKKTKFFAQIKSAELLIQEVNVANATTINTSPLITQMRALSHQVYGAENSFAVVQLLIFQEIITNANLYQPFVPKHFYGLQNYVSKMITSLTPSNIDDIRRSVLIDNKADSAGDWIPLQAFANCYSADLLVYSPMFDNPLLIRSNKPSTNGRVYCVGYLNPTTYCSLVSNTKDKMEKSDQAKKVINNAPAQPRKRQKRIHDAESYVPQSLSPSKNSAANSLLQIQSSSSSSSKEQSKQQRPFCAAWNKDTPISENSTEKMIIDSPNRNADPFVPNSKIEANSHLTPMLIDTPTSNVSIPWTNKTGKDTATPVKLMDACLRSIVVNIDKLPYLRGTLPEELVQKLIHSLIRERKLNDYIIDKLLSRSSYTRSLDFSNSNQLSYNACMIIATNCTELRRLSLAGCSNLPLDGLELIAGYCSKLQLLNLDGCSLIEDRIISQIAKKCPNLKSISLRGCCKITDKSVYELSVHCKSLKIIRLMDCGLLTNDALVELPASLEELELGDTFINDIGLVHIAKRCTSMKVIKISGGGKKITDSGIRFIAKSLSQLQVLELISCDISDASVRILARQCKKLQQLRLSFCRNITSFAFMPFQAQTSDKLSLQDVPFPYLLTLDLARCLSINDDSLGVIVNSCPNLTQINLSGCEDITDKGILKIASKYRLLTHLNISKCTNITDKSICAVVNNCPYLKDLALYNCINITDKSLIAIAKYCKNNNLIALDISSCDKITNDGITAIASSTDISLEVFGCEEISVSDDCLVKLIQFSPKLNTLKLAYCKNITDYTIDQLAKHSKKLQVLDLSYCNNIQLHTIGHVLSSLPLLTDLNLRGYKNITTSGIEHSSLRVLNLSWCKNIEDAAVIQIANCCPSLVTLDLAWCSKITMQSIYQLSQQCASLQSLNLRGCTKLPFLAKTFLKGSGIQTPSV